MIERYIIFLRAVAIDALTLHPGSFAEADHTAQEMKITDILSADRA